MDIQATKLELMQLLLLTEEESILEKIKALFKEKNTLSEKELNSFERGLDDELQDLQILKKTKEVPVEDFLETKRVKLVGAKIIGKIELNEKPKRVLKTKEKKLLNLLAAGLKFKIGTSTIVEYLNKNGFNIDKKPTSIVSDSMYKALLFEFGNGIKNISDKEIHYLKLIKLSAVSEMFNKNIDEIIKIIENNINPRFYNIKLKNHPDQCINNIMLEVLEEYTFTEKEKKFKFDSEFKFLKEDNDYTDFNDSYCGACHQSPCMCSDSW